MVKRLGLTVQNWVAQLAVPFTFGFSILVMKVFLGYRIENLRAFRQKVVQLLREKRGPILVCPNHLTMIDSVILVWAMTPTWMALAKPRMFPWNTPEKRNFSHVPALRFFCYLGKCLPVIRQGTAEQTKRFLEKLRDLMSRKQSLMMFPEGTRSPSGRVDTENYSYGVGKILQNVRQDGLKANVLVMYLRGHKQRAKSWIPRRGERFFIEVEALDPQTASQGLRAQRDLSQQIIRKLAEMEQAYLSRWILA
jgi:1-acyl-sn-glycerol-3-phosphate acyltransferase